MKRFLVDAQLPPGLAEWLGKRGYAAAAVRDVGLRDSDDGSIRFFLARGNWVLKQLHGGQRIAEVRREKSKHKARRPR